MRPKNLAWHFVGCVQCAANDHFTRLFLIYINQHEVCIVQSPTWFSFQVSRQFLLSHFLAPLCLIITLIMFSDRITTVSLDTSLCLLCWPSVLQVWPPWCPRCPPPLQPLTASWLRATSTPASPTSPATSTSGRRLTGLSEKYIGNI